MDEQLMKILKYMPRKVSNAIQNFAQLIAGQTCYISEIRLRADAPMSVTFEERNVMRFSGEFIICNEDEIAQTLQRLCEDSVHTYSESLKDGYVILENGYRIGVCGRVGLEGESIKSVYGMTSLSIRIPHPVSGISCDLMPYLYHKSGKIESILIYAIPNVGKTTLIRDIAARISSGTRARRTALIDTRGEIYMKSMFLESIVDVLHGYPRAKGIEIATRTLSPEVIFCDEIGSAEEARAILSAENSGVPLIATAHADTLETLLKRPNIRMLYEADVFRYYVGLSRKDGSKQFSYDIYDTKKSEVSV